MYEKELDRELYKAVQGQILRPAKIAERLGISVADVYRYFSLHENRGRLTSMLDLQCPFCGKSTGNYVQSFFDIPNTLKCPHCERVCSVFDQINDNAVVVYQKEND